MGDFDYVIVGAGSAGCVLAERLSASGRHKVLLIEEGGRDDNWLIRMPQGFGRTMFDPRYAAHHHTARKRPDGVPPEVWTRGRGLGGSSSINGMVWVRGQPEDFDRIAELGNPGWSWADVAPYFKRLENHALGEDEVRGRGGPVSVRPHPVRSRLADAFIASGQSLGVAAKDDLNRPEQEGVGYLQVNVDAHGQRVSAARAFLEPALKRPNLAVMTNARVERVLFEGRRAVGVVIRRCGERTEVRTAGEIILSAGGLVSPKILQLSGIGPAERLGALGIAVTHNSPGVGENMREHFLLMLQYRLKSWRDSVNRQYAGWRLFRNVAQYALSGTGLMTCGAYTAAAFTRTERGLNRPDAQLMFAANSYGRGKDNRIVFDDKPGMHVFGYLLRPESRGWVRLVSPDPEAAAEISPQYLTAEADRTSSVAMVRQLRTLMSKPPIADLVDGELPPTLGAQTDEEILAAFKNYGGPGLHACGTCAMGQGPDAVVDERLRVRGVERLRVMDTSIYPEMLSGNTNAPTMALAWRASDLILEDAR